MASAARDDNGEEGVEFIRKDDGGTIAQNIEMGIVFFSKTKSGALRMLSEALLLHEGGGEPATDEGLEELGPGADEFDDRKLPDFM